MRWLLIKDLQILKRSPLLVGLLVVYPIVLSVLIGFALSRGPDKPKVAFLNLVPQEQNEVSLGDESVDVSKYADQLFDAIDPVRIDCEDRDPKDCEREAVQLVENGDVLGALVIPEDITSQLQSGAALGGGEAPKVRVYYNAEDPAKRRYVESTIESNLKDANAELTKKFTEVALEYLDLIVEGGTFDIPVLGGEVNILGLRNSAGILRAVQAAEPRGSPAREQLAQVIRFAELAQDNLDLSDEVLSTLGEPIQVEQKIVKGGTESLSSFAVAFAVTISLMFVTVLLAAGVLALEREENAFLRLVRGLVSRTALLVEKAFLSAICALGLALLMLAGLSLFVDLDWGRFPQWLAALAAGGLAFAAMGLAIGALAREVRAASLLAFMLSLPIAFLALVPSGSVSGGLYSVVEVVSALFPFKPSLDALDSALNDSGDLLVPILHLAALTLAFGVIARLALRRFV